VADVGAKASPFIAPSMTIGAAHALEARSAATSVRSSGRRAKPSPGTALCPLAG
jgi:hypothetical protein